MRGRGPLQSLWLCRAGAKGPGTPERGPLSVGSPQGVDAVVLSVLDRVGVPARALIPYVT